MFKNYCFSSCLNNRHVDDLEEHTNNTVKTECESKTNHIFKKKNPQGDSVGSNSENQLRKVKKTQVDPYEMLPKAFNHLKKHNFFDSYINYDKFGSSRDQAFSILQTIPENEGKIMFAKSFSNNTASYIKNVNLVNKNIDVINSKLQEKNKGIKNPVINRMNLISKDILMSKSEVSIINAKITIRLLDINNHLDKTSMIDEGKLFKHLNTLKVMTENINQLFKTAELSAGPTHEDFT